MYDQYGKEGLDGRGGGGGDGHDDILSALFGQRGGGRSGPKRGEDKDQTLKVSLEDLYNGRTSKLAVSRKKPCSDCGGKGGKEGAEKSCSECNGRGMIIRMRQIGPGMVQQVQAVCPSCRGARTMMDEKDKCGTCKGSKVVTDRKIIEVVIEKGMQNGQKIKFSGEADEIPGTIPGDINIILELKQHDVFKRKGADLLCEIDLTLNEALCGFVKTITHLDKRVIKIESRPGEVVKQDAVKIIQGEGMPHHGNPFTKGRLFVHFNIIFPKTLPANVVAALSSVLPRPTPPVLTGEEEECVMTDVDVSQFGMDSGRSHYHDATDEDDQPQGGPGVQCRQG